MQVSLRTLAITSLIIAGASVYVTRTFWQKEIVRVEVKEKETVKKDIVTTIKEVKRVDGSIERSETIVDRSTENRRTNTNYEKITTPQKNWNVSVYADKSIENFALSAEFYGVHIQRRILGPFFLGVKADTNKTIGLSIAMEF